MQWEIASIIDAIIFVTVIFALLSGTAKWCEKGFHRKAFFEIVAGLFLTALMIGSPIYVNHMLQKLTSLVNDDKFNSKELLSKIVKKDCHTVMAAQKIISESEFIKNGVLKTYKNCQGEQVLFTPTQEDIDTFKERVKTEVLINDSEARMKNSILTWIFIVIFSVLFGLSECHRKRREQ